MLISLFALLTAGCATSIWDSSRLTPVTNQAERIDLRGFSILPPPGENWYLSTEAPGAWGTPPPRAITFYKRLAGVPPTHTFFLMARSGDVTEPVTNLAELRDLVERTDHEERRRSGRFTILSSKLSVDGSFGAECVRTEVVMDERENPNPGVGGLVLVLSNFNLMCLHPQVPKLIVRLSASERHVQGDQSRFDEALRREAEAFFQSIQFVRVP